MTIGNARMVDGLYYSNDSCFNNKQAKSLNSNVLIFVREQTMPWHLRLGHPSFRYLRHLFPYLFKNLDYTSF